jgi:replicative DNA helicase
MTALALDRPLPQVPDAERAVLAAILIEPKCYHRISLTVDDFAKPEHAAVYDVMARMVCDGDPLEILTLKEALRQLPATRRDAGNRLEEVGGVAFLTGLLDVNPDVANIERYAEMVDREARKRRLVKVAHALLSQALDPTTNPDELATAAMAKLGRQATQESSQAVPLIQVLRDARDRMELLREEDRSVSLVSGWKTADAHRIFRPTFAVTASASKHGKTAAMLALATALASNGHPVAIFSLESSQFEIASRYFSAQTGIGHDLMQDWRLFQDSHFRRVSECERAAADRPVYITGALRTVEDIVVEIKRLKAVAGLQAAFIDYIQIMDTRARIQNREERLAEISKTLLATAVGEGVHINGLSQINEDSPNFKANDRLTLSDLAYAKAIGKSARIVNMFRRPGKIDPESAEKCVVQWQIEANNEGRTNDFWAHFDEETQRFTEGTCEENNCRRLGRSAERDRGLFGYEREG